jgi:hypothetical protein
MNECEKLRLDVLARKQAQNERREKAGKKPMHALPKPAKGRSRAQIPPIPESGDIDDSQLTFQEWSDAGWSVRKGSKAVAFDCLGNALFDLTQVQKTNPAWAKWRGK